MNERNWEPPPKAIYAALREALGVASSVSTPSPVTALAIAPTLTIRLTPEGFTASRSGLEERVSVPPSGVAE